MPPATRLPLTNLGLWERFVQDGHAPSHGLVSAWGQDELFENHFVFNPYGHGWHIDRARFDAMLASAAEEAGVQVCRGARAMRVQRQNPQDWRIEFTSEGESSTLRALFLVQATGRASLAVRTLGERRIEYDRLVGLVRFYAARLVDETGDDRTMVEAAPEGWWYSAWLPDSRLVVAYMTDADLKPAGQARLAEFWRNRLEETRHTRLRVMSCSEGTGPNILAANSYRTVHAGGVQWLAVGDAAAAYDPLSSRGIFNALESGLQAAHAVESHLLDNSTALREYDDWVHRRFDGYLRMRERYYDMETRWPGSLFWQRRQTRSRRESQNEKTLTQRTGG